MKRSFKTISPVAMGTKIVAEINVTPQLIPCLFKTDNNLSEAGINFKIKIAIVAIKRL